MIDRSSSRPRSRSLLLAAGVVYLPFVLLLVTLVVVSSIKEIPIANLIRDTTAVSKSPFYTGAISNIGIYMWCATAAVCLFSSALLYRTRTMLAQRNFLFTAGIFTSILMADDAFMIHEVVAPRYFGLPPILVLISYAVLMLALLIHFRGIILKSDYIFLLIGLVFLASSLIMDFLQDNGILTQIGIESMDLQLLLEDGCKLLGIVGWFSYFVWHSYACVTGSASRELL